MLPPSNCILDMAEVSLSREGYTSYLGVPEELKVQPGEDVVLKCSASSSEEPSYFWHKEVRKPGECAGSSSCFWKVLSLQLPLHPPFMRPLYFFPLSSSSLSWLCSSILLIFSPLAECLGLSLWLPQATCFSSSVIFRSPPHKKCSVFKWPVGLGPPLAGDSSLSSYGGLIV